MTQSLSTLNRNLKQPSKKRRKRLRRSKPESALWKKTERRKYDKEQKKKAQLEEDLLPEVMLKEGWR